MISSVSSNAIAAYRLDESALQKRESVQVEASNTHKGAGNSAMVRLSSAGIALATKDDPAIISDSLDPKSPYYGKYSEKEISDAQTTLNQLEFMAFGYLAGDASTEGIIKLSEAYLKYINSLSPEAQQTGRYAGTKESATNLLTQAKAKLAAETANGTDKKQEPTSFILMMLEAMSKNLDGKSTSSNSSDS